MIPRTESLHPWRWLTLPLYIRHWRRIDYEHVIEVLVAPVIGSYHSNPVDHAILKRGFAHRVDYYLTCGAISDVRCNGPAIHGRRRLEPRCRQNIHCVVDTVLFIIWSPSNGYPSSLIIRGIDRRRIGNWGRRYAVIETTCSHDRSEDGCIGRVELASLVDACSSQPVGLARLEL